MTRCLGALLGACILAFCFTQTGFAQQSELELMKKEIEALKQSQQLIMKELQEMRKLLQAKQGAPLPATANVWTQVFDLGANPVKGQSGARLTLVEFTDYQ